MNEKKRSVRLSEGDWDAIICCLYDRTLNGAAVPGGCLTVWTIGAKRIKLISNEIVRGKPKASAVESESGHE